MSENYFMRKERRVKKKQRQSQIKVFDWGYQQSLQNLSQFIFVYQICIYFDLTKLFILYMVLLMAFCISVLLNIITFCSLNFITRNRSLIVLYMFLICYNISLICDDVEAEETTIWSKILVFPSYCIRRNI